MPERADQRRGARAELGRLVQMTLRHRPDEEEQQRGDHREGHDRRDRTGTREAEDRGHERAAGERREEEAHDGHLPHGQRDSGDRPPDPHTLSTLADVQKRPGEVVGIEGPQVLQRLPDADELHRDAQLAGDRKRDAALAVPSSFVSTMPSTGTASEKSLAWRSPFWPVVASTVKSVSSRASASGAR